MGRGFLPTGAGALDDTGTGGGVKYSVNVPLQEGMDDASYQLIFQPVMAKVPPPCSCCCATSRLRGSLLWRQRRLSWFELTRDRRCGRHWQLRFNDVGALLNHRQGGLMRQELHRAGCLNGWKSCLTRARFGNCSIFCRDGVCL